MVIRAFVHLIKVGRQPFAARQSVNAYKLQTPPVGIGMPTYKKPRRPVGRQSVAAARGRFFLAPKKINRIKTLLLFKEESPP